MQVHASSSCCLNYSYPNQNKHNLQSCSKVVTSCLWDICKRLRSRKKVSNGRLKSCYVIASETKKLT